MLIFSPINRSHFITWLNIKYLITGGIVRTIAMSRWMFSWMPLKKPFTVDIQ